MTIYTLLMTIYTLLMTIYNLHTVHDNLHTVDDKLHIAKQNKLAVFALKKLLYLQQTSQAEFVMSNLIREDKTLVEQIPCHRVVWLLQYVDITVIIHKYYLLA